MSRHSSRLERALAGRLPIWLVVLFFCLMCLFVSAGIYIGLHAYVIGPDD
jgi:hypothetical protein